MRLPNIEVVVIRLFFLMPLMRMWLTDARHPVSIGPVYTAFITFAMLEAAQYALA